MLCADVASPWLASDNWIGFGFVFWADIGPHMEQGSDGVSTPENCVKFILALKLVSLAYNYFSFGKNLSCNNVHNFLGLK